VAKNIQQKTQCDINQGSAQTTVNHNSEDCQEKTMRNGYVAFVEHASRLINTQQIEPVQENVLWKLVKSQKQTKDVYDITVEDEHEFFANNVLVHNCEAARYLLILRPKPRNYDRVFIPKPDMDF
jgi:hypothetical protein